jgi:cephalosporin hydroxylase
VLENIVTSRRTVGRAGKVFTSTSIEALSTVNNLRTLRALMLQEKPSSTIETGLGPAGSALMFAATHRDLGHEPVRQHVALDPNQTSIWDNSGRLALENAKLEAYVEVREEESFVGLPKLLAEGRRFDMAYIDGSHQFEDAFIDFFYIKEMLNVGGLMIFDDSIHPQVRKVLNFIQANYNFAYQRLSIASFRGNRLKYIVAERLHKTQMTVFRKIKTERRYWNEPLKQF